ACGANRAVRARAELAVVAVGVYNVQRSLGIKCPDADISKIINCDSIGTKGFIINSEATGPNSVGSTGRQEVKLMATSGRTLQGQTRSNGRTSCQLYTVIVTRDAINRETLAWAAGADAHIAKKRACSAAP